MQNLSTEDNTLSQKEVAQITECSTTKLWERSKTLANECHMNWMTGTLEIYEILIQGYGGKLVWIVTDNEK